jgi:polyhydroxyalkanoate synthesis regulator phasin
MGRLKVIVVAVLAILCFAISTAFAGEIDILVNKLVEKGVLTRGEAQQVVTEAKEEARTEIAQGKNEVLPKWLQTTKFSGDLRVRYQGEEHSSDPNSGTNGQNNHRDRGRFRLRFGFDMKPNDLMHVGFRLATGENKSATVGPEQTSTNQSFTNSFNNKFVWVDQAYFDYVPFGNTAIALLKDTKLIGGKFPNPFYTTDMVWDPDTNPEGGVIQITPTFGTLKPFLTFGFLPFGENQKENNDPFIWAGQVGLGGVIKTRPFKVAAAYYGYENVKGMAATTYTGQYSPTFTNTQTGSGLLMYGFNIFEGTAEYSPMDLSFMGNALPLTFMVDYAYNAAKADDTVNPSHPKYRTAWLAGAKLGKAKDKGTWEAFYNFREIGRDSVYSWLNDSDFHLGGTASMGHKFGLTYAIMPNSTISGTYYITRPYKYNLGTTASVNNNINIIQLDWVTKF